MALTLPMRRMLPIIVAVVVAAIVLLVMLRQERLLRAAPLRQTRTTRTLLR